MAVQELMQVAAPGVPGESPYNIVPRINFANPAVPSSMVPQPAARPMVPQTSTAPAPAVPALDAATQALVNKYLGAN
jgi:hypothetical protein